MFIRCFAIFIVGEMFVFGGIQNGRFELPDANSPPEFVAPSNWLREPNPDTIRDCYAGLHSSFNLPLTSWTIPHPAEGTSFVVISTDGFDEVQDREIRGAAITQQIVLEAGNVIKGFFFFGTTDYRPYNDYGHIILRSVYDPNSSFLVPGTHCDIAMVGNYGSSYQLSPQTDGWIPFAYAIEPNQAGTYVIECYVQDDVDTIYPSFYAVDNLRICTGSPLYGDLNFDCAVDAVDFSIFTNLWLADCDDPNTYDPNFICPNADFSPDGLIDPNDLALMSEHWLENYKPLEN